MGIVVAAVGAGAGQTPSPPPVLCFWVCVCATLGPLCLSFITVVASLPSDKETKARRGYHGQSGWNSKMWELQRDRVTAVAQGRRWRDPLQRMRLVLQEAWRESSAGGGTTPLAQEESIAQSLWRRKGIAFQSTRCAVELWGTIETGGNWCC